MITWSCLEMEAPEDLRLARNGPREIAALELRARGAGKNAGLLSGWARRLFRGRSPGEIREIAFELGVVIDLALPVEAHEFSSRRQCRQCGHSRIDPLQILRV